MNETNSNFPVFRTGLGGRGNAKPRNGHNHKSNFLGAFTVLLALALTLPLNRA